MKYLITAVLRYAMILGIFVAFKFLMSWKFVISWNDIFLAAIFTIISMRQSQVAQKKEKEAEVKGEKLAEARKKNEKW